MYWITHFVFEGLPTIGMRKLLFYTQLDDPEEFFWDTDNNSLPRKEVEKLASEGKIIPIPQQIPLKKETDTLYIDDKGVLWLAHYMDSAKNRKEIGCYDVSISQFFQELEGSVD